MHGLITFRADSEIDQLAWKLIDTPEFQRLRRIKQLGVSEFTFPNATHTRFAHCIGVFHTARTLIEVIRREVEEAEFQQGRADVALIAALLHDLGHGPFSHTFEGVQKSRGVAKRHELWTAEFVRQGPAVAPLLAGFRSDGKFGEEVAAMLEAEDPIDLYHAVVSSSFDADRLDYLRRDRLMTGTQAGAIDFDWLLEHVRVREVGIEAAEPDDGDEPARVQTFCLDLKALPAAEQFLLARYTLHEQVYFHKTTRSIEHLIAKLLRRVAGLARADATSSAQAGLAQDHPVWRFFQAAEPSLDDYLGLDDVSVMAAFEQMSRAPDATVSALARRLRERRLYKTLDVRAFGQEAGRRQMRVRQIDNTLKERAFKDEVYKDEDAKIGIYTQIGGDDERIHKKLHIWDGHRAQEISQFSPLIQPLADKQEFTRYYFANEEDRDLAKNIRRKK